MSVYSQSLKTEIFDPRIETADRVEFRLDKGDNVYFSNLRLANVGVSLTGGQDTYNKAVGVAGNIRRITLLDGAIELDRCVEVNRYLSWFFCGADNNSNRHVQQNLVKHSIGYRLKDNLVVDGEGSRPDPLIRRNDGVAAVPPGRATDAEMEKVAGYLDLRQMLPILDSLGAISTEMFENLRLVIEYEPDTLEGRSKVAAGTTAQLNLAKTNLTPMLLADEIKDPALKQRVKSNMKSFQWNTYEHDLVDIPAQACPAIVADGNGNTTTPNQLQKVKRIIDGFKNKYVSRLVLMKCPQDKEKNRVLNNAVQANGPIRGVGDYASLAMNKEKINFIVNGRQLFAGEGLDTPAKIADVHADTWGNYNILPYAHTQSVGLDQPGNVPPANVYGTCQDQVITEPNAQDPRVGQSAWVGCRIGDTLNTLELDYERQQAADQRQAAGAAYGYTGLALDVHVYAEVPKKFIMEGGKYRIEYL